MEKFENAKKDIFENNKLSDQSRSVLIVESELYFADNKKYNCKMDGNVVLLNNLNCEQNICLRGDNLITRKQMYNRVFEKNMSKKLKPQNNGDIFSFILMPHIKYSARCQINSKRASCGQYNDNPFVFFRVLKNMYLANFEKENADKVETFIIMTKPFWETFGKNIEGYNEYLNVFCSTCINDLMTNEQYKMFFLKYDNQFVWGDEEWEVYNELLVSFQESRKVDMLQRKIVSSKNIAKFCEVNAE